MLDQLAGNLGDALATAWSATGISLVVLLALSLFVGRRASTKAMYVVMTIGLAIIAAPLLLIVVADHRADSITETELAKQQAIVDKLDAERAQAKECAERRADKNPKNDCKSTNPGRDKSSGKRPASEAGADQPTADTAH